MTSKDDTWHEAATALTGLKAVTFGDGLFTAVGLDPVGTQNKVFTSQDGKNWTVQSTGGSTTGYSWYGVTYGTFGAAKILLAVGQDATVGVLRRSVDGGISWTAVTSPTLGLFKAATYSPGTQAFLAIASTGTIAQKIVRSTDGCATFSFVAALGGASPQTAFVSAAADTANTVVAATATGTTQYSTNGGNNWTIGSVLGTSAVGVSFVNGKFIVPQPTASGVHHSTDGITWTFATNLDVTSASIAFSCITYSEGRYWGHTSLGAVYSSTALTGVAWDLSVDTVPAKDYVGKTGNGTIVLVSSAVSSGNCAVYKKF